MKFGLREMVFVMMLLAILAGAYIFVFVPRNVRTQQARQERMAKQAKLTQLEQATKSISDLGHEIDKISAAIADVEQKLPSAREEEVILREVSELAAKHTLSVKRINPDKAVVNASHSELPIRIVINGDFDRFYTFMLDLEQLKRITRMKQMSLKKTPKEEGQMSADLVLSIFFEGQRDNKDSNGAKHS